VMPLDDEWMKLLATMSEQCCKNEWTMLCR